MTLSSGGVNSLVGCQAITQHLVWKAETSGTVDAHKSGAAIEYLHLVCDSQTSKRNGSSFFIFGGRMRGRMRRRGSWSVDWTIACSYVWRAARIKWRQAVPNGLLSSPSNQETAKMTTWISRLIYRKKTCKTSWQVMRYTGASRQMKWARHCFLLEAQSLWKRRVSRKRCSRW